MKTSNQIHFSVNHHGRDKSWDYELLASKWTDEKGTLWKVVEHIKQGHALCAGLLGGNRRTKANVIGTNWILLDIDNSGILLDGNGNKVTDVDGKYIKVYKHQMTLDEALSHPFINKHCALIYTTANHKPDWHKFRLIFLLPQYVTDVDIIEALVRLLMKQLPHDSACKDASRVFFGNSKAEFPLFNPKAYLPPDWVEQAITVDQAEQAQREYQRKERKHRWQEHQYWLEERGLSREETHTLVLDALRYIPPRSPGSGNYDQCRTVLMALHSHFGEIEAEQIAKQWSPSIPGTTWNLAKKLRSFKRSGVTISSLFWIAQKYGWKFPKKEYRDLREPDSKIHAQHQAEQAELERVELIEQKVRGFGKVKRFLKHLQPKHLPFELPSPTKKLPEALPYAPGNIPWRGKADTHPKILYTPEQLPQLLSEARNKGWRDILDSSSTGAGKSHRYATLSQSTLGVKNGGRSWLLSQSHRNPTTAPAEHNYAGIPVRTRTGFIADPVRRTATGRPFLRYPTPEEARSLHSGNCHMADLIHTATAKSITAAKEEAQLNPFCTVCKYKDYCAEQSGSGFGYRRERRQLFENNYQIRSSIKSLPNPNSYPYEQDAVILDEALQQLKPVQTIRADTRDFAAQCNELEYQLPQVAEQLSPLRAVLGRFVRGVDVPYQGFNHDQLLSLLPPAPEGFTDKLNQIRAAMAVDIEAAAGDTPDTVCTQGEAKRIASLKARVKRRSEKLKKLQMELIEFQNCENDLLCSSQQLSLERQSGRIKYTNAEAKKLLERLQNLPDLIAKLETELAELHLDLGQQQQGRQMVKNFNRRQYQVAKESLEEKIEALPNQWMVPFLEVWSGSRHGALRINPYGNLSVTLPEHRHNRILDSVMARYYLDATANPEMLAIYRQISVSEILWIEQKQLPVENLDFVWVKGFGLAGKRRTDSCDRRLKVLHSYFQQKHPDLATFDWKSKKEVLGADGHYFSDSTRGTNEFTNRTAIVAIGLPMPDMATFYDLWLTTRTNESLSFNDFYYQLIDAEIIQAVGRLRANRRHNEALTFYLVGDTEKCCNANYQPPAQLNPRCVEVKDLCSAAASKSEQAWLGVWEVIQHWWTESGELPTQREVSEKTGIDRSWISKLAAQFIGGWKCLKKVILSLVSPTHNDRSFIESLPEGFEWIAKTYLPLIAQQSSIEVAQELSNLVKDYGWRGWVQILSQTSQGLRLYLIAALFQDAVLIGKSALSSSEFTAA